MFLVISECFLESLSLLHNLKSQLHVSDSTLRLVSREAIDVNAKGNDRVMRLKQQEAYWILSVKAAVLPGLNVELDSFPFL